MSEHLPRLTGLEAARLTAVAAGLLAASMVTIRFVNQYWLCVGGSGWLSAFGPLLFILASLLLVGRIIILDMASPAISAIQNRMGRILCWLGLSAVLGLASITAAEVFTPALAPSLDQCPAYILHQFGRHSG